MAEILTLCYLLASIETACLQEEKVCSSSQQKSVNDLNNNFPECF